VFDARGTSAAAASTAIFGAKKDVGLLERCDGGTLVIDEPGELPQATQTKIVRFLETRSVARDDGVEIAPFDTRVVAISRADIEHEVQAGRVREDLAALLGAARVELPPLRERTGDVTLLATAFFRELRLEDRVLSPVTIRRFESYSWPGNVRELKNAVIRWATTGDDAEDPLRAFRAEDAAASPNELYQRVLAADLTLGQARDVVLDDFERRFVKQVLARYGGNVTRAAAASGLARRYFQVLRVKRGV
jgi:DNA-binding NtrC family response regulator